MRSLYVTLAVMLASPAVGAEQFLMMGAGVSSCADFGKKYQADTQVENLYFTWAQGYMSARNNVKAVAENQWTNLNGSTTAEQKRTIRAFCAQNPLSNYVDAVDDLYLRLTLGDAITSAKKK